MSGDYYTLLNNKQTAEEAEIECRRNGKHLASFHSASELDLVFETCQCDSCWIGLQWREESESTEGFEWNDKTLTDTSFINHNWCDPNVTTEDVPSPSVLIDSHSNCWYPSANASFTTCGVCGPFMLSNAPYVYHILLLILMLLFLSASLYLLPKNEKLRKILKRNSTFQKWILMPSTAMKRTALCAPPAMALLFVFGFVYSVLLETAYAKERILPPVPWIHSEYPVIYTYIGVMKLFIVVIYAMVTIIVYLHLFFRLSHSFNSNPVFRAKIPTRCDHAVVVILIIFYVITVGIYSVVHIIELDDALRIRASTSLCVVDILMHSYTLYLYCKTFYKCKAHFAFVSQMAGDYNQNKVNNSLQSHHEISIEFRRYTVVFVTVCVANIITIFGIVAVLKLMTYEGHQTWLHIGTIIFVILLYSKAIISLQCIYFSFNAHHIEYKKCCNFCDQWMEKACNQMIKMKSKTTVALSKNCEQENKDTATTDARVPIPHDPYTFAINPQDPDQITIDDYLPQVDHETESHHYIAEMQNAEENVQAVNDKNEA